MILKTTDGGVTWYQEPTPAGAAILTAVAFRSPQAGLVAGTTTQTALFVTSDGGETWHPIRLPAASEALTNVVQTDSGAVLLGWRYSHGSYTAFALRVGSQSIHMSDFPPLRTTAATISGAPVAAIRSVPSVVPIVALLIIILALTLLGSRMRDRGRALPASRAHTAVRVLLAALLAVIAFSTWPESASASDPAYLVGDQWLGGDGATSFASTYSCCITGSYIRPGAGGDTDPSHLQGGGLVYVGPSFQCVELAQRLYTERGWYTGAFKSVGYATDIYKYATDSTFERHPNGSGYVPVPGDMVVMDAWSGNPAGHVAVVDTVTAQYVDVVEENWDTSGRATYSRSGPNGSTLTRVGAASLSVLGVVHAPADTLGTTPPKSLAIVKNVVLRSDGNSGYFLDGYGTVHPFGGAPAITNPAHWTTDVSRSMALCPASDLYGYFADLYGGVHPLGEAPPVQINGYWQGQDVVRSIMVRPDCQSGYVIDLYGGIHPFASTAVAMPSVPPGGPYWAGVDAVRGAVLLAPIRGVDSGYILDEYGGVHPFGNAPVIATSAYWFGSDVTRGIAIANASPIAPTGYVLDDAGGIHPFGGAPAATITGYWAGSDVARGVAFDATAGRGYDIDGTSASSSPIPFYSAAKGVVVRSDGQSGYAYDGYGGTQPFGGAPPLSTEASWATDVVRGLALCPSAAGSGYLLDDAGGVHPFGSSPNVSLNGYWPGQDVARAILLRPDCESGYVIDLYGGIHPFASSQVGMPPVPANGPYWSGLDAVRGAALVDPIGGLDAGYILDDRGGVHPFGAAPAVSISAYWSGDCVRGMTVSNTLAGSPGGYVLDYTGVLHEFGSAHSISGSVSWWPRDVARGVEVGPPSVNSASPHGWYVNSAGLVGSF